LQKSNDELLKFEYSNAVDGLRQILWGLFKKAVVADNCAVFVNKVFDNPEAYSGSFLLLGALFFAIQIYCDFSGYSDIALGTARLFGIELLRNFAFPYFSRDIAEFWRRWHISLTTWFRDYLYIPLGGSRGGTWMKIRNTFIIFLVSGFWHGANWTFIVWGALNALYFIPLMLTNTNRNNIETVAQGKIFPSLYELWSMLSTFTLVLIGWIFFRAESITHAWTYITGIFSFSSAFFNIYGDFYGDVVQVALTMVWILFFLIIEWVGREQKYALEKFGFGWYRIYRKGFYYLLIFLIFLFSTTGQEFIYFQF
jgi:Predicted membrane protein involved in D-alanine export